MMTIPYLTSPIYMHNFSPTYPSNSLSQHVYIDIRRYTSLAGIDYRKGAL